jgi:hypothetical protein
MSDMYIRIINRTRTSDFDLIFRLKSVPRVEMAGTQERRVENFEKEMPLMSDDSSHSTEVHGRRAYICAAVAHAFP